MSASEFQNYAFGQSLEYTRFTRWDWPARAYLPGNGPHPSDSPAPHLPEFRSEDWRFDRVPWYCNDLYLYGCDLFNHGYWWEAHEVWEPLWIPLPSETAEAAILQGWIQAANALLKVRMNRMQAVRRLTRMVADIAETLPSDCCLGVEPAPWFTQFSRFMATVPQSQAWILYPYVKPEHY